MGMLEYSTCESREEDFDNCYGDYIYACEKCNMTSCKKWRDDTDECDCQILFCSNECAEAFGVIINEDDNKWDFSGCKIFKGETEDLASISTKGYILYNFVKDNLNVNHTYFYNKCKEIIEGK